jgi:hypothetical protein
MEPVMPALSRKLENLWACLFPINQVSTDS